MGVKINKIFQPLYTSKKRYFLLTGGRGSLKSSTVHDFIARLTYERGHGVLFTRYTMTSAELSIIPEFQMTLERLKIEQDFHITRNVVTNKRTGSFIYFSGIRAHGKDQTGKLKSIAGITTWVVEEGEDFNDENAFNVIDDSIRTAEKQNRVIWIQNPTTRQHFIYKRFIKPSSRKRMMMGYDVTVSNHPKIEHIHTTYHIAEKLGYLSKDWLDKAEEAKRRLEEQIVEIRNTSNSGDVRSKIKEAIYGSHYYLNYIGGWLERAKGAIFVNWIEGEFDESVIKCYGMDYGYYPDPLALIEVGVDKKRRRIYVREKIYATGVDDVGEALEGAKVGYYNMIVADTSEPRTTRRLRKRGFNVVKAVKEKIADDIREINTWVIVVDPESENIKMELNEYKWNDKKASIPIDAFNHLLDAMRYAFNRLVKGKRSKVVVS